jgi:hypothetical protein
MSKLPATDLPRLIGPVIGDYGSFKIYLAALPMSQQIKPPAKARRLTVTSPPANDPNKPAMTNKNAAMHPIQ